MVKPNECQYEQDMPVKATVGYVSKNATTGCRKRQQSDAGKRSNRMPVKATVGHVIKCSNHMPETAAGAYNMRNTDNEDHR